MFSPGDVIRFKSDEAGKTKFHLCIHADGSFLFLNSPKPKAFPGDFQIPSKEIGCLTPTPEGYSIVSCTHITKKGEKELKALKDEKIGKVEAKVLLRLIAFVEKTPVLSQEDKDEIIEGLADWASLWDLRFAGGGWQRSDHLSAPGACRVCGQSLLSRTDPPAN